MEQKNDAKQPGHDVDLIGNVNLVWRDDRYAKDVIEAGGEYCEPHQRTDQCGEESTTLLHEFEDLPRGDGPQRAHDVDKPHGCSFEFGRNGPPSSLRLNKTGMQATRA